MVYATQTGSGGYVLPANEYINWGSTEGSTGYGIRDNSGNIEFSGSGGSWDEWLGTSRLSSTGTTSGASLIGANDAGSYYSVSDLEGILQQVGATSGSSSGTSWQDPIIDKDLATPPSSPTEGDRYIISSGTNWYDSTWGYRRLITIDNTKVPSDQTDFVVYFAINATDNLFTNANADGSDILFTEADGTTLLPYDLELYDSSTENMTAWVRMTLSSSVDTTFYMYYGNSAATSLEDVAGTWSDWGTGTTIFSSVYHMDDSAQDSTTNNYDFITSDFIGSPVSGTGNYGHQFEGDGASGWTIQSTTTPSNFAEGFSTKSFVYLITTGPSVTSSREVIHSEGGGTNGVVIYLDGDGTTQDLYASWWTYTTTYTRVKLASGVGTGTVYLLDAQYEYPGNTTLYLNGTEVDTPATINTRQINSHFSEGGIGANYGTKRYHDGLTSSSPYYYTGNIHEAWELTNSPDANWNTLLYNNLLDFNNFVTIGAEDNGGASGAWAGHEQEITEYESGAWVFYTPSSGWAVIVVDENLQYTYDGGGAWEPLTSSLGHNYLSGLQGGDSTLGEYYHLTSSQHAAAIRNATNSVDGLMPSGKLNNWEDAYLYSLQSVLVDGGSHLTLDTSNKQLIFSGSGAVTTSATLIDGEVVIEAAGEYELGGNALYIDTAKTSSIQESGTATVFTSGTGYHLQLGASGGCSETVGVNDLCISGVTEISDRLVVRLGARVYGDLEAQGNFSVIGTGSYNGPSVYNANSRYNDNIQAGFGTSDDASILWDTTQTNDSMMIGVGSSSETLILADSSMIGSDLGLSTQGSPTLVIPGAGILTTPSEWMTVSYSPIGAKIGVGSGNVTFELSSGGGVIISNLPPASPTHTLGENSLWVRGDEAIDGSLYVDSSFELAGTGSFAGSTVYNFTSVNSATYTVTGDDRFIGDSYTVTGTGTITIPSSLISITGWSIDIKDSGGNASVYPVIIATEGAETIDGAASLNIAGDRDSYTLLSDGTNLLIY